MFGLSRVWAAISDVAVHAAVSASATHGSLGHANTNDPTANQKAALAGTGTPSGTDKYVSDSDARNTNARTPTAHGDAQHNPLTYEASGAVATHAGLADPHAGYQKESEKAVANGYASLGAGGLVPIAQLASGTPDGTQFVRDDGTLAAPTAALPEIVYSDMTPEADVTVPAGHCAFIWSQIAVPDGVTVFIGDGAVLVITG